MAERNKHGFLLLGALLLLFLAGVGVLMQLRFQSGDVYPPYSSLRADPLGTGVLYTALDRLGPLKVSRNYRPLERLVLNGGALLMQLGARRWDFEHLPAARAGNLRRRVAAGARLVAAFYPQQRSATSRTQNKDRSPRKSKTPTNAERQAGDDEPGTSPRAPGQKFINLSRVWGWRFETGADPSHKVRVPALESGPEASPGDGISWHSTLYFGRLSPAWRVTAVLGEHPVVVERRYGAGSIVLMADVWPLSNQAMRAERRTALLAWLLDGRTEVVFDESHLGIVERRGMTGLAKKYGLLGLLTAIAGLALLFAWRQGLRWVPTLRPLDPADALAQQAGRDDLEGMVSLMRQHIPTRNLLRTCLEVWQGATTPIRPTSAAEIDRMAAVAQRDQPPEQGYEQIQAILERKGNR